MMPADAQSQTHPTSRRRWLAWLVGVFIFLVPLALWPYARAYEPSWQSTGSQVGALSDATLASEKGLTFIYRWSPSALLRSVDEGRTWATIGTGLPKNTTGGPALTAMKPGAARTLYALAGATERRGLFRSTDNGATFDLLYQPLQFSPKRLAIKSGENADIIMLADDAYLTVSQDGGITWQEIDFKDEITALFADIDLWVGGPGYITFSPDNGETWQRRSLPPDLIPRQLLRPRRGPSHLYVLHDGGLLRSSDTGTSWQVIESPTQYQITALASDPVVWQTLFVGDSAGQVWRSDDWGNSWIRLSGPTPGIVRALFLGPVNRDRLYVVAGRELWWKAQQAAQPTPTSTPTPSPTPSATPTATNTSTSTPTSTPLPTDTSTPSPSPSPTFTSTATGTPTPTATPTKRRILRPTISPTPTTTPQETNTPTPQEDKPSPATSIPKSPTPAPPTPIPTPTKYR